MALLPASTATAAGLPDAARPVAERDALAAAVADPLWFLARQWQTGEYAATDGGSPVRTELTWASGPLRQGGVPITGPLEPTVEPEPVPSLTQLDTRRRIHLATELRRTLRDRLTGDVVSSVWAAWVRAYPFDPAAGLTVATSRLPDPVGLLQVLRGPLTRRLIPFPTLPGTDRLDATTVAALQDAVRGWYGWGRRLFTYGTVASAPPAWDPARLAYRLSASAGLGPGSLTVTAGEYDGTGLDWYSVDGSALDAATPVPETTQTRTVTPTPVSYAGMPRPRWWEFEDGDVNLDALRASSDPARAVLATFAHSYSNDWYLCPLQLDVGWAVVRALTVTDTFGTQIAVPSVAALDGGAGPWRLWDLTRPAGVDAATGLRLCWPVSPPPLDSSVREEVLLARDEFANLAWVVELQTTDADGSLVDRYRRWQELRPEDPTGPDRERYRLGTTVPDFWYPLTVVGAPGSQQLQRADLPAEASGVSDAGVQGDLVPHTQPGVALGMATVSRQGRRLARRDRLVIGAGGVQVWRVRVGGLGTGDASSGLRFDLLA